MKLLSEMLSVSALLFRCLTWEILGFRIQVHYSDRTGTFSAALSLPGLALLKVWGSWDQALYALTAPEITLTPFEHKALLDLLALALLQRNGLLPSVATAKEANLIQSAILVMEGRPDSRVSGQVNRSWF